MYGDNIAPSHSTFSLRSALTMSNHLLFGHILFIWRNPFRLQIVVRSIKNKHFWILSRTAQESFKILISRRSPLPTYPPPSHARTISISFPGHASIFLPLFDTLILLVSYPVNIYDSTHLSLSLSQNHDQRASVNTILNCWNDY